MSPKPYVITDGQILRVLGSGPKTANDIARAIGLEPGWVFHVQHVELKLKALRARGLVISRAKSWRIAAGSKLCPQCEGRMIVTE